jgi:hypothetical protein
MLRIPNRRYPADYLPLYVLLEKKWQTNAFVSINDMSREGVSNLISHATMTGDHTEVQLHALFRDVSKLLKSFQCRSFHDYTNMLADDGVFAVHSVFKGYMLNKSGRDTSFRCTDMESAEFYWAAVTDGGNWGANTVAVTKDGIRGEFFSLTNAVDWNELLRSFPRSIYEPSAGFQSSCCAVAFTPTYKQVMKNHGSLFVADISILVQVGSRYDGKPRAYPVVLRLYWHDQGQRWLPLCQGYMLAKVLEWQPVL